jgi:CHRD domain
MALILLSVASGQVVLAFSQSAGAARTFQARLSTVPIDLGMAATVAGGGSVTATLKGRTLTIAGKFSGLKTPATIARLHRSPNRGIRGAAFADLTVTAATAGEISGAVELSAAQVEDLEKGRLYLQLHSEKAPEGNLWGWLLAK